MQRILHGKMEEWNVVCTQMFAGRDGENNATILILETDIDDCAYTIDISTGNRKMSAPMDVKDNTIECVFPADVMAAGKVTMQIVGVYENGTVRKSNIFSKFVADSLNASDLIDPDNVEGFNNALADYANKLLNAKRELESINEQAEEANKNIQKIVDSIPQLQIGSGSAVVDEDLKLEVIA